MQTKLNPKSLSRLACVIQRLERQGVAYEVLANGALKVKQHGKPKFTPNRLTTAAKCLTAHAHGRVIFNARGTIDKKRYK